MSISLKVPTFKTITVGKGTKAVSYNAEWLRSVSEKKAIQMHYTRDRNQVVNVWKQSNGLTKRTYTTEQDEEDKVEATPSTESE